MDSPDAARQPPQAISPRAAVGQPEPAEGLEPEPVLPEPEGGRALARAPAPHEALAPEPEQRPPGPGPAQTDRPLRILCLDGGGMKNLVQALVLQRIERSCGKPIAELFDLVCGTSFGGIVALATCGTTRMTADDVVRVFECRGREMFPGVTGRKPTKQNIMYTVAGAAGVGAMALPGGGHAAQAMGRLGVRLAAKAGGTGLAVYTAKYVDSHKYGDAPGLCQLLQELCGKHQKMDSSPVTGDEPKPEAAAPAGGGERSGTAGEEEATRAPLVTVVCARRRDASASCTEKHLLRSYPTATCRGDTLARQQSFTPACEAWEAGR
jgi:hypothetical protein